MSGKGICTVGSVSGGTCGCSPLVAIGPGSPNVLVNGKPVITVGMFWNHHHGDDECNHPEYTVTGNPTILVNGRPVVTIGHVMSRGDIPIIGSPNVLG